MIKELGKIKSVFLGFEGHGILTFSIGFDFGGSCQSFGGYALDTFSKEHDRRIGHAAGTDLILSLLTTIGVDSLEKAVGKPMYALRKKDYGPIIGIETPSFDGGRTFLISEWQKLWFGEER